MRSFPSAARSRLVLVALACVLGAGAAVVPVASADHDLKHRQQQVEREIDHAHDELEHSSARTRRAARRLEAARQELAGAKGRLAVATAKLGAAEARDAEMQARLVEAEARLAAARAELAEGELAVTDQRDAVADMIVATYQQGDPDLVALSSLLDAQDPDDLARRLEANRTLVGKEDAEYDELRATEVLLRVREARVAAAQEAVAEQRAAAAEHLRSMEVLHSEAKAAKAEVASMVASSRAARVSAWQARRQDAAVLRRLREREARIERKIMAAARAAQRNRTGVVRRASGYLTAPSRGPVTSPYGYREHPIYGYYGLHDGTDFGAACGSPLVAVADGTVISSYYSSVYGKRLHLTVGRVNGTFLTAVYNHAFRYTVGPGERVERGEVIGYVGSTGWSTGCHLHFSVLADGKAVDPMRWI